jgi:hypothetical protein
MTFLDENGKVLTREQLAERGYGHLCDDAAYLTCDSCGLKEYAVSRSGNLCLMSRPDGKICVGNLKINETHQ